MIKAEQRSTAEHSRDSSGTEAFGAGTANGPKQMFCNAPPPMLLKNLLLLSSMQLHIPLIDISSLNAKQQENYHALNSEVFGEQLARSVAGKLETNKKGLYHAHRDYCGQGLFFEAGKFLLTTVYDGYGPDEIIASFADREDFATWLAGQSDQSMSVYGKDFDNQTITRIRLNYYLEDFYDPGWSRYVFYLHKHREQK